MSTSVSNNYRSHTANESNPNSFRKMKRSQKPRKLTRRISLIPSYLNSPSAMVILAKPNGKLEPISRIIGFSINDLLSNCTQIMKLTSAARKLYLNNGKLVENFEELRSYDHVYVSLGEPFSDPIKKIKESILIKEGSFWGLNGLYIPKSKRKAVTAAPKFGETNKIWRVLTFMNQNYLLTEAVEIISDLKDIDEFQSICSKKFSFNGQCKRLFTADEVEISDLKSLPDEESYVWNTNSDIRILGPVWATKNEDLNKSSVYNYFSKTTNLIKNFLNDSKSYLNELIAIENEEFDKYPNSKMKSFSKPELKVRKKEVKNKIEKHDKIYKKFKNKLQGLPKPISQTMTEYEPGTDKSIYQCAKGLKLKVYQNGQDPDKRFDVFFNVAQAKRGINDSNILFSRFLDCLSESAHLTKVNDFSRGILVRRVFTEDGEEINNISQLSYDQVLCVSHGEDWINPIYICTCAKFHFLDEDLDSAMFDFEVNHKSLKKFKITDKFDDKNIIYDLPVLQNKEKTHMFIMMSICVQKKQDPTNSNKNNLMKSWMYTVSGRFILKSFPSLCLTLVTSSKASMKINKYSLKPLKSEKDKIEMMEITYYCVQLESIQAHNNNQIWHFNKSGLLYNEAFPGFFLTFFENISNLEYDDVFDYFRNSNILASEKLPDNLQVYQRWAFKQESFDNLNQWKLCDLPNPEWHKTALTWPLKSNGDLNHDLKWPIEGLLVPCVPSLEKRKFNSESRFPMKLTVLRNNDHNMTNPVLVCGPDLTKLIKKGKEAPFETHCTNLRLLKLEFEMFLDSCTNVLRLPSAARRLFDENGKEIFDLDNLQNNDLVYVSIGDIWCSPEKALSQIELRSYANKLTVDVERLKYFLKLYQPKEDFVVGLKNDNLHECAEVEVQIMNELSKREIRNLVDIANRIPTPEPSEISLIDDSIKKKTFHERCCDAANKKSKIVNHDERDSEIIVENTKNKPNLLLRQNFQQFLYQSSRIVMLNDRNFSLFADAIDKPITVRKLTGNLDNKRFKWIFHNSGVIESMHFRGYVIGVVCLKMLPFQEKASKPWINCSLILEKSINSNYGKGHQKFKIDSQTGLFYPFVSDDLDKKVTAAMLAGICTKYVYSQSISQPGGFLEINQELKSSCNSCIGIMDGRYPIIHFDEHHDKFSCSILGGFKVINKKADLLNIDADKVYESYLNKLKNIRQQLTIKVCKSRFTESTKSDIQVLLHLNVNKNSIPPQKITAKSISQLMDMATGLFNLQRPVRILYNINGEEIVDDLSFKNIMSQGNDKLSSPISEQNVSVSEINKDENDIAFNISLSDDQCFFIVEFANRIPTHSYSLIINISSINGIELFRKDLKHHDSAFLFNYEIFNNQINTELFISDLDFEGEQTELSFMSSPTALKHLFTEVMKTLRFQLISARINSESDKKNEFQVDIESIDGIADFSFSELSEKLQIDIWKNYSTTETIRLISTEDFLPTTATLTLKIELNEISKLESKQKEEKLHDETESVILEPTFKQSQIIELWASVGEPFCSPSECRKNRTSELHSQLKLEIDKKKYLLRKMKGERFKKMNAGTLETTPSEKNPVKIKGNWQFPTEEEIKLSEQIENLEINLNEIKQSSESDISKQKTLNRNLYKQKHMKNCLVHINGKNENTSVSVWGESIWEILQNSVQLLGLKKTPKHLFKKDGKEVTKIDEISTGEILAVSYQPVFISPLASVLQCEIKANWGRARRQYGESSTDIKIQYRPNTLIDIDPFEPPDIMKNVIELPADEPKTIKVFENGQSITSAKEITGYSLSDFLKRSMNILNLSLPVKCFYALDGRRITSFKEILNDDILAASVSGRGLLNTNDS